MFNMTQDTQDHFLCAIDGLKIHDHICSIYETKQEQMMTVIPFLRDGLERNEKCVYIADENTPEEVLEHFKDEIPHVCRFLESGALVVIGKEDSYLKLGYFDADWMMNFLAEQVKAAQKEGYKALRVTGEASWALGNGLLTDQLIEYESKVNNLFSQFDVSALCQYNKNQFHPEIIKNVLETHPTVIYKGTVCKNYHYIPPEEFLSKRDGLDEATKMLNQILLIENYVHSLEESEQKFRSLSEDLIENERRFETAEALAHVGSWILNVETGEMEISEELQKIFGLPENNKSFHIHDYIRIIHPDDRDRVLENTSKHHSEGIPLDMEYRIIRSDGQVRYIHGLSRHAGGSNGRKIRYGATKDITDRKLIQLKLEEILRDLQDKETNLSEAQKLAHVGSFIVDYNDNARVDWTEEMYRIYERDNVSPALSIQEAYGMVHPDDIENVAKIITAAKDKGVKLEADYRIITGTNKIKHLHSTFNPVYDRSGKLTRLFGTSLDVTESMKQHEILRSTLQRLEKSNKELEQFAYIASHDLKEPLRMITGYIGMLEKNYKKQLGEKAEVYFRFAVEGAKRMNCLINDLLIYSRVTTLAKSFELVDLNSILEDVQKDLQVAIEENKAKVRCSQMPEIKADDVQMRQLFQNLISNAVKFKGEDCPQVDITAERKGREWLFCVKDNGIGINPAYSERIFLIFQRLNEREKYEGTGIGLAVCKKIVERHGGRIWAESEEGKGSKFYFTIPS